MVIYHPFLLTYHYMHQAIKGLLKSVANSTKKSIHTNSVHNFLDI